MNWWLLLPLGIGFCVGLVSSLVSYRLGFRYGRVEGYERGHEQGVTEERRAATMKRLAGKTSWIFRSTVHKNFLGEEELSIYALAPDGAEFTTTCDVDDNEPPRWASVGEGVFIDRKLGAEISVRYNSWLAMHRNGLVEEAKR